MEVASNIQSQDSEWFQAETARMSGLRKHLWRLRYDAGRKMCFFSQAPNVAGIPEEQQERNRLKLIWLKTRGLIGKLGLTLSFSERKKLALSNMAPFYRNFAWGVKPSFEIDEPVRVLAQALNKKEYTYSGESCSGHLKENPENHEECMFFDTGYETIRTDEASEKAGRLIETLTKFCEEETVSDPDCKYILIDNEDGSYTMRWGWKDPQFEEVMGQLYKPGIQNTPEEKAIYRKLRDLSPRAREKGIPQKYRVFLERAAEVVRKFE
jgi:hypothetical protein